MTKQIKTQLEERKKLENSMLSKGHYLRVAALGHMVAGTYRVKVIFRNQDRVELAYWMSKETYDSFPLLYPATPSMFAESGTIVPAQNTNIYDTEEAKAVTA